MKKYLIAGCAAAALVGCAENRGGIQQRGDRTTGVSERQMNWDTNSISNTNGAGAPGNNSGTSSGTSNNAPQGQQNNSGTQGN